MNAMGRFTIKSLRANRVRTAVTVAGVALAAALLTAVLTSFTSLTDFLYRAEAAVSGDWMVAARSDDAEALRAQVAQAEADGLITGSAVFQDVGFGQLSKEQQEIYGRYLPVMSMAGEAGGLCALTPVKGRLPEGPDEVMLFRTWDERGDAHLGDALTLPVGQREAVLAPGESGTMTVSEGPAGGDPEDFTSTDIADGTLLDSSIGYLDASENGGGFSEGLTGLQERTFTVVGFYDSLTPLSSPDTGTAAFTAGGERAQGMTTAYATMDGVSTMDDVERRAAELFPDAHVEYHTAMLRYMGVTGNGAVWSTFFGIAGVLAAVIVGACVSLIYNAFAISVAERTKQFGLLSSVGASKKQLRRAVMLEALLVAAAGIPLGLAIGIGGTAITLGLLGPSIATVAGDAGVAFQTAVRAWVLVLAACLTLVTVLVSVSVPAWRAGRSTAIEALHNDGSSRLSKKAAKRAGRSTDASCLWKRRGAAGRLFGMGGTLAHLNTKRGATKGAAAAVSLAMAVVLLMTAGSLNTFLGQLVEAASGGYSYDIGVGAQFAQAKDDPIQERVEKYAGAYDALCQAPGAQPVGWTMYDMLEVTMPGSIAGEGIRAQAEQMAEQPPAASDSDPITGFAALHFLEDGAFDAFAQQIGADPAQFHDPAHPRAIATAHIYGNDGSTYQLQEAFSGPGQVSIDGEAIDIAQLADDMPAIIGGRFNPTIVVPLSLADAHAFGISKPLFNAGFNAPGGDHAAVAEELSRITNEQFADTSGTAETAWHTINDHLAEQDVNRLLATVVNVFCLLFTVILALIAMANVFNTVTNSLILRRREFAVMRSIGLSSRQFRAMIADECASFGVKGLVPGMLISAAVSYLLFRMVTRSMTGLAFALPWPYVALAVGMTAAAMSISVAFGMHRCKADNVVEALRMDSI